MDTQVEIKPAAFAAQPTDRAEVVACCPRCGEPVRHGRCTNVVKCAYLLPESRLLKGAPISGSADRRYP